MQIFRTLNDVNITPSACAMGMFDGVHLGHRMVLEQALRAAKINQWMSVVFTFTNHPQSVVSKTPTPLLSSLDDRVNAFALMGFDAVLLLDFTSELRDMPSENFVKTILLDTLKVKEVSVGYDHRFGKDRKGDGEFLKTEGLEHGFTVDIIAPVRVDQQIISSTLIRKLLAYGDLERANQYLGYYFKLTGKVVGGDKRGKNIGFPTANLYVEPELLIPAQGVYAGTVYIKGEDTDLPAVCNIGIAPTFGSDRHSKIEIHILDYEKDLYGKTLTFTFLHHLRNEITFPSVNELVAQLNKDCLEARALLNNNFGLY